MPPKKVSAKPSKGNKSNKLDDPSKRNVPPRRSAREGVSDSPSKIPLELQQLLLNVFRNAFPDRFGSDLKPLLQEVKQHLYNREFIAAFGKDEYLEAYAVRWSPSRALGYLQIFSDLEEHIFGSKELGAEEAGHLLKIVCLGGGAGAEIVGLAGLLKLLARNHTPAQSQPGEPNDVPSEATISSSVQPHFDVSAIDIANWSPIVTALQNAITTVPPLSKYASAAAREANVELLHSNVFNTKSIQQDILAISTSDLSTQLRGADLVTIMFTLNELYTTSLAKTQAFLLRLTNCLQPGSLLLVVDSPGSYSAVTLNGAEKQYPMHWLLDHTLLLTPKDAQSERGYPKWEKLVTDQSRWFRLPKGLRYPIDLENMRYQIHLYRRVP